jgi:hypothetical protein
LVVGMGTGFTAEKSIQIGSKFIAATLNKTNSVKQSYKQSN